MTDLIEPIHFWVKEPPLEDPPEPDTDYESAAIAFEQANATAAESAGQVRAKLQDLRNLEEARRLLRLEQRGEQPRPRVVRLDEFLSRPNADPTYRIQDVWPTGGRVVLAAQFKAGKTTLVSNAIRALADGDDFLDRFPVRPGAKILLIDNELDERTLQRWLNEQGIQNQAGVSLLPLRGRVGSFDILDPEIRTEWAQDIGGADVVIFDCLRPVLDALGLDESREAGRFFVAFDALLAEAGATEALLIHHMGHNGERARGDSRINDWPDATWKLVRDKDDEDPLLDDTGGARYFSAFGRDVNVAQAQLEYDPDTRRLTLGIDAQTRKQATQERKIIRAEDAVIAVIRANPGINKTGIRQAVAAHGITHNPETDAAVARLIISETIRRVIAGKSHHHYLADSPNMATMPNMPNDAPGAVGGYVPNALTKGTHTTHTDSEQNPRQESGHIDQLGIVNGDQEVTQ